MAIDLVLSMKSKNCSNCTKCCDGWLTTNIYGNEVMPGKPCVFVEQGVGCSIYKDRPLDPCHGFKCEWLVNPYFPPEFKPSESNLILTKQSYNNIPYLLLVSAGEKINEYMLSFVIDYCKENRKNLLWQLPNNNGYAGTEDFCNLVVPFLNN